MLAAMASTSTSNSGGPDDPEEPVSRTDVTFLAGDDPKIIIFISVLFRYLQGDDVEVIYTLELTVVIVRSNA